MAGARLYPYDFMPRAQQGGLRHYPLSGVAAGTELSNVTFSGGSNQFAEVTVSEGEILFDSQRISHNGFSPLQIDTGVDLSTTEKFVDVWLVPTRIVPYFTDLNNPPSVSSVDPIVLPKQPERKPKEIKLALYCADMGDYLIKQQEFYSVDDPNNDWDTGGNWKPVQDMRKIPYTRGNQNQYPMNIVKKEVTSSNVATSNEKEIFHSTQKPPYLNEHAKAVLRQPGGIKLGVLYYDGTGNSELYEDTHTNYLFEWG